jgi:hypothetical protein
LSSMAFRIVCFLGIEMLLTSAGRKRPSLCGGNKAETAIVPFESLACSAASLSGHLTDDGPAHAWHWNKARLLIGRLSAHPGDARGQLPLQRSRHQHPLSVIPPANCSMFAEPPSVVGTGGGQMLDGALGAVAVVFAAAVEVSDPSPGSCKGD